MPGSTTRSLPLSFEEAEIVFKMYMEMASEGIGTDGDTALMQRIVCFWPEMLMWKRNDYGDHIEFGSAYVWEQMHDTVLKYIDKDKIEKLWELK